MCVMHMLYADNTSIYLCSNNLSQLNKGINDDLEKLGDWLKGNKFSINVVKVASTFMRFQKAPFSFWQ